VSILDTGVKQVRNIGRYIIGQNALSNIDDFLRDRVVDEKSYVVFFVDEFFKSKPSIVEKLPVAQVDKLIYLDTSAEPTVEAIDGLMRELRDWKEGRPVALVAMGGGATMDICKAVANLYNNEGSASSYQGWDLVKNPGVFKVAVPTLSGTGAEATRTCVMTNKATGLKLGMNSDHTVFDAVVMDPELSSTVPRNQYFYTGMDAYIHCVEALEGTYRNPIGDAYSNQVLALCREIFLEGDMMTSANREKLMVASYLGGCSIATSYVGVVHPFSAALSVVFGYPHCLANCIVMRAMAEFYPSACDEFWRMVENQQVDIPQGICRDITDDVHEQLYNAAIVHEKPLTNALGETFKSILTPAKVRSIFELM
jgi:3-deoxy-alpha-D-manno-octulosonate 8-oxidase